MSLRRIATARRWPARILVAQAAILACLGAGAYAATRPEGKATAGAEDRHGRRKDARRKQRQTRPLRPRFLEAPTAPSVGAQAQLRFHLAQRAQRPAPAGEAGPAPGRDSRRRFQCRLDSGDWGACDSPHRIDGLAPGAHEFAVRALSPAGRPGPAAHVAWEQLVARPFSVAPRSGPLEDLYPGDPAQALPVLVANPNPVPIVLTSLTVAVGGAPPGCPADPNFAPTASSVSPASPLIVPAEASVGLPSAAASAPAIALRDLPASQDACQGVEVSLVFSGEAYG